MTELALKDAIEEACSVVAHFILKICYFHVIEIYKFFPTFIPSGILSSSTESGFAFSGTAEIFLKNNAFHSMRFEYWN